MKTSHFYRPAWILATLATAALAISACSVEPPPVTRMKLDQAIEGKAITLLREGLRVTGG